MVYELYFYSRSFQQMMLWDTYYSRSLARRVAETDLSGVRTEIRPVLIQETICI